MSTEEVLQPVKQAEQTAINNGSADLVVQTAEKVNNFDEQPIGGIKNSFDEKPIGGGKKFQMSQYPDASQPPPKPPVKKTTKKATKTVIKDIDTSIDPPAPAPVASLDEVPIGGGRNGQFDDVPIGKTANKFEMSQFPEGDEQPVVQTNYTMSQKLKSKAVKLKLSGMEDLLELLQKNPNHEDIAQIQIGKLLKETNPACLQKILQCLKVWVQKQKKWEDDQVKSCIQNGYINGKPNTKKLSVEIVDEMYEKSPDTVEMAILVGLKGKVPKTLAGYIAFLNELLAIYGMKRMKFLKPYFPDIITILNREKLVAVKTEGINILKQAYKWLSKEVIDPLLKDLKQGLKKELDTFWESHDKTEVMKAPKDIPETNDGKAKKKVDAYELSEAVDVFKKYNQKFSEQVINQQKWSQKVRMMTQFYNAANVPKLAQTQYRHINEMIRRLINHSNFNVVLWDLKILAVLSKGLRRNFAPTVRAQFSNVLSKFREKRTQMVDETFNTLNEFNYCISIEDVLEDVKEGLTDKAPTMRVNIVNWIGKFVQKKIQEKDEVPDKAKDALRALFGSFQKLLGDGVAEVRDAMAKNIGKMKILMGDDFFAPMDKKMSKGQAGKIDEVKKQLPQRKVSKEKEKKEQNSSGAPKHQETVKGSSKNIQNNSGVSNQGKGDISEQIQDLIPKMNHSDWQKRKESAEAIFSIISNNMDSKINSTVLNDFLSSLKIKIADPNKNNVKSFVQLTALVFETMSDRDIKANAKNFICALADGLSDKMEANRKQISIALNKLGSIYGKQQLLSILGAYLDNQKQSRIQVINLILENEEAIEKADTREYPKGIIRGLLDKNKQIRSLSQRLLQRIQEKTGLEVFKNLARNQRPALAKDLNAILAKFESVKANTSTLTTLTKGASPPKPKQISGKKNHQRSDSKNSKAHQQSFEQEVDSSQNIQQRQFYSTMQPGSMNIRARSLIEGNDDFAPLKILSNERVARQQKDERYPWNCDSMLDAQEQQLREYIDTLFKADLAKKMLSINYRRVQEAGLQIIKLAKDIAHHSQIREVYDLIFKWVFIRLWGGNPAIISILEVLPNVMSILEKKKLAISDSEVDIIVAILRESFITGYMNDNKVSQCVLLITKLLIALSSGDRLLKKLLRQFSVQVPTIHRHVRGQSTQIFRAGLREIIKKQLMEYVGNGSSLQEASRIKQLKNDAGFVELLYKRFHQNVLDSFGFRNNFVSTSPTPNQNTQKYSPVPQRKVQQYETQTKQTLPPPITTGKRTPTQSIEGRTPKARDERLNTRTQELPQSQIIQKDQDQQPELGAYNMPPQGNPLGKHLSKLSMPADVPDTIIAFFTSMFTQTGEKTASELSTYSNSIFLAIFQSVQYLIEHRNQVLPQKIVNHINLLQQAIKCKYIMNNIDRTLLYYVTKFALHQLVYEDEYKNVIAQNLINRNIDFKPDQFIKIINGIMLRILQNACPQETVNILLSLLNKQMKMPETSQKTVSLIIKCLSRVSNNYNININGARTRQFFQRTLEYFTLTKLSIRLQQFNPAPEQKLRPEQNVVKTIKFIINELIKNYGSEVWVHYQNAVNECRYQTGHIQQYFKACRVDYPESIDKMSQENQNLKKINDLLSKTRTFETGVTELRRYMSSNPEFAPIQYFTSRGYEQKFIAMVMNALQNVRPRKTPTKRQIREERSQNSRGEAEVAPRTQVTIQDKIQRLKQKFDEGPQRREEERPSTTQTQQSNFSGRGSQHEERGGQERAQQIKRRIDEMRSKLNRNN